MEPKDAAEAAASFLQAMTQTDNPLALGSLARYLSALADRMDSKDAGETADTLLRAMTPATDSSVLHYRAQVLSVVAARMKPKAAAAVCRRASAILRKAMMQTKNSSALRSLAQSLSALAGRMGPKEAAAACGQAAIILRGAMTGTDPNELGQLAQGLSAVAGRMDPKEATAECGHAAATFLQAMTQDNASYYLAQVLSELTAHLEMKEAAAVCKKAAVILRQAMTNAMDPRPLPSLARGLTAVGVLDPKEAEEAASVLFPNMTETVSLSGLHISSWNLKELLRRENGERILRRGYDVAGSVGVASSWGGQLTAATQLQPALKPPPPPLPAQTLVNLLKQPFCVGEARRLVLDQLARHYHRPFADQWDFVRYVQEHRLGLDLTTPPQRPIRAGGQR
jgi:hypothetical protein